MTLDPVAAPAQDPPSISLAAGTARRPRAEGAPLGPGSILWSIASDPRGLMPGTAAGIMQLMLPGLGAGVTDHSNFFDDPMDRILRSIPVIWRSIFAVDDQAGDAQGRTIRDLHADIKGVDHHGERYHALDPDVYWWAHATFTWEFFRARELYFPRPLRRAEQEQLYAESVTWYRRYGVSERPVPQDLDAFKARFHEICAHELELTPAVAWVLDPDQNPAAHAQPRKLPGPFSVLEGAATKFSSEVLRLLVYGGMPDIVRRRFDFPWTNVDRLKFAQLCALLRTTGPAMRRGFLAEAFPAGTPHLKPGSRDEVIVATGPRQA